MIAALLIANRGEIARRIIRTAQRLGVRAIAVYSVADAAAPHVREADAAIAIGPSPAGESYLLGERLLDAARASGAEAVHPGYGFLSENADFAQAVMDAGLVWVGPPPKAIRAMGRKDSAKRLMQAAGVPVTPGYLGDDQSPQRLATEAAKIGWPVLIKAVAGGGGKGMRKVDDAASFPAALAGARRESAAAFGDDRVLLEKYVDRPRHIEVQVFADRAGQVVHLFERDCSLQRRHQKVIEEAPAPGMEAATREVLCAAAIRATRAVEYEGAGTVEFIADSSEGLRSDRIWFMEMNTRLQVEHPVTEAVTGLDLVEWQLRIASGESLPLAQDQIACSGHAIEARLYAEDPATGFLPSVGPLTHFRPPGRVRVDSGVEEGGGITAFYDPMIAKLIAHAPSRGAAAATLAEACRQVQVWPVRTNGAFLARCLAHPDFLAARIDTSFIEARADDLAARRLTTIPLEALAALERIAGADEGVCDVPWSPVHGLTGFRLNAEAMRASRLLVDGIAQDLELGQSGGAVLTVGETVIVFHDGEAFTLSLAGRGERETEAAFSDGSLRAPMPGRIVAVTVRAGETVAAAQPLLVLEAMKMEHALVAPFSGVISELFASEGEQVSEGAVLLKLQLAAD